jgi:CDP-2,3-bis-(O-geranylgeranyl)-sn-glycerol synthase
VAHALVLRYDLLSSIKRPIDGGRELGGHRLLGDNKTWRGALVLFTSATATTVAMCRSSMFRERLPDDLAEVPAAAYGALLGVGVVAGELPTSFVKRQLGIGPGRRGRGRIGTVLSIYDQGDLVLGSALALRPVWRASAGEVAGAFLVVSAVHLSLNVAVYAAGARETVL